jgi:uncharacterized membrane protein YdfJ with MMPL/SSD domain
MQNAMLRLDALVRRRRLLVVAAWAALLVAALPLAAKQGEHLTGGGFDVPGSESTLAQDALERSFPEASRGQLAVVLVPREGATREDVRAALARAQRAAAAAPDVEPGPAPRIADGRPVVAPLAVDADDMGSVDVATDLRKRLGIAGQAEDAPVGVHLVGQGALWAGLQDLSKEDLAQAEGTGFPVVLLILLAVFGSLAAAALPLALGLVSVLVTGGLIWALSQALEMSVFVTNMASMIGIGVAVDYSLFVLARFREEVAAGRTPDEARSVALATSGVAVTFSGLTVVVSLAGLFLIDAQSLRSMALGAILVVAVAVLAAATLLPALISLLGRRAYEPGRIGRLLARRPRRDRRFWARWTAAVMGRPVLAVVGATAVLLALAAPALDLTTTNGALRQFPEGNETRVGFEAAASVQPAGASAPVRVVVDRAEAHRAEAVLRADAAIARVEPPRFRGDAALVLATPREDGESAATKAMVGRLREALPPSALLGGTTAQQEDFGTQVDGSMWKIALFVLGLSFLVLLLLLRSAVLPLKAAVMNLLSVGAAYGVLALVFGEVETITPPLVLAVVFGLSMDYEVFLLSRIRERFGATGDTRRAVAEGLEASARTITSAALIMVAVFAVFTLTGVPSIQQLGLGCAVAIALDATLVRLVLVPAAMELLGRWNWWLPTPLERALPHATVEELGPRALAAVR